MPERIQVPDSLADADIKTLESLRDRLRQAAEKFPDDLSPEQVEDLESLARQFDRVQAELAERAKAQAEMKQRANAAKHRFGGNEEGEEETPAEENPATPLEAPAAAAASEEEPAPEPVAAAEDGATAVAALSSQSTPPPSHALSAAAPAQFVTTSFSGVGEGKSVGLDELATIMTKKRLGMTNVPEAVHGDRISLAVATLDIPAEFTLTGDVERNFAILRNAEKGVKEEVAALVASGAPCDLAAPSYDIFRLARPHSPVESSLRVVGAPRGAIKWIVPPAWQDARAAVGVGGTPGVQGSGDPNFEKPCVHVNCPGTAEVGVIVVSTCVEFDNLTYRVFPELTAAFMEDVAVNHASVKETFYLDAYEDDADVAVTFAQTYGAIRSTWRGLALAAHGYRKRNGMDVDAVLDWRAPDFLQEVLKADAVADHDLGMNFRNATTTQLSNELAAFAGVNAVWYYDTPTGLGQSMNIAQADGALNEFPTSAVTYLEAPGTHVRLDAGTLDLGIVRDSTLNRTNDLQIFSEQWINVAKLGIETVKLTFTGLCPTGQGPEASTALSC